MAKNIVICCDGTGNEINTNLSNVLKLFRVLVKDADQRVFYHPGVGTIGLQSTWERLKQKTYGVFSLATGAGLDQDILAAYRFLCETYQSGDKVWLFGFSRGAYTVRVLAAFIHVIGLLPPDQSDLAGYALSVYKNASANGQESDAKAKAFLDQAWQFRRVAGGYLIPIEFMGVWDTVASVIVPRTDKFLLDLQTLVYTRTNPSVKKFRQAMAIDERRRMFRLNRWVDPQQYRPDQFNVSSAIAQDIRQVWFAGVHGDVGGGYPEVDSGLSKYPLLWMIEQAKAAGLRVDDFMVNHLGWGWPRPGVEHQNPYVAPSPIAKLNVSLKGPWWILEFLPKQEKYREWLQRKCFLGFYIPDAEPRPIPGVPLTPTPEKPIIHRSVLDRMAQVPSYRPINMPVDYFVEEGPVANVPDVASVAAENRRPRYDINQPDAAEWGSSPDAPSVAASERSLPHNANRLDGARPSSSKVMKMDEGVVLTSEVKAIQRVFFSTNRLVSAAPSHPIDAVSFTSLRTAELTYGVALVGIPKEHEIGRVERPKLNWFRLRIEEESDEKHFRIRGLDRLSVAQFSDQIANDQQSALIFVHGYNVSFQDAVFKAAQIAFDANYVGTVIAFSWPSRAEAVSYDYDRESANYSPPALLQLIKVIKLDAKIKDLFLVAHSLGSQIVVDALQHADQAGMDLGISELIFAAPDVDRDVFKSKAAQIMRIVDGVTLYASSADKALIASKAKAGGIARAGDMPSDGPLLLEGIDLIDVTAVGEDMFAINHGIFSSNRSALDDLGRIVISRTRPPHIRTPTLQGLPTRIDPKYWMFPK